jgi:D-amino-acid dehydrogenase
VTSPRVIVIGGGIIGVSCAYYLARGGAQVTLLERDRIGAGASSGNAGTIAVGHPPLNRPGRIQQAVRQMLDPTSPLYIQPRFDPRLWMWLARFGRYCTDKHVEHCMSVMAPLGRDGLAAFDEILTEERIECEYSSGGYFEVCHTERGLAGARHEASVIERYGFEPDVLDGDEMVRREPALGSDVVGAVHYKESASLNPFLFLTRLARAAQRLGVVIEEGTDVVAIAEAGGYVQGVDCTADDGSLRTFVEADAVVATTGAFSLDLLSRWGGRLPVVPGKGYHRDVDIGPNGAPRLKQACVLAESSVFCTPMDTFVRFAGTMEFSGENHALRPDRLQQLTHAARAAFPQMGIARPVSEWAGLRPVSVDGLPIVGAMSGVEGVYVATGHGMLGLTLGPVTGKLIASEVLSTGEPRIEALSPQRFG